MRKRCIALGLVGTTATHEGGTHALIGLTLLSLAGNVGSATGPLAGAFFGATPAALIISTIVVVDSRIAAPGSLDLPPVDVPP